MNDEEKSALFAIVILLLIEMLAGWLGWPGLMNLGKKEPAPAPVVQAPVPAPTPMPMPPLEVPKGPVRERLVVKEITVIADKVIVRQITQAPVVADKSIKVPAEDPEQYIPAGR
jgi:hypothetical protein